MGRFKLGELVSWGGEVCVVISYCDEPTVTMRGLVSRRTVAASTCSSPTADELARQLRCVYKVTDGMSFAQLLAIQKDAK